MHCFKICKSVSCEDNHGAEAQACDWNTTVVFSIPARVNEIFNFWIPSGNEAKCGVKFRPQHSTPPFRWKESNGSVLEWKHSVLTPGFQVPSTYPLMYGILKQAIRSINIYLINDTGAIWSKNIYAITIIPIDFFLLVNISKLGLHFFIK